MNPKFFANQAEFRAWLSENHRNKSEILVGFYKVKTGKPTMTWSESVDQALCFGWIDGIRRSIDEESYSIRFTPRNPKSVWSAINIKKVEELTKQGLMLPAGLAKFEQRTIDNSEIYAYENKPKNLDNDLEEKFKQNEKAWEFFSNQAPSYQRTIFYWIMSAKQEKTRLSRLEKLIFESENLRRLQ